MIGDKDLPLQIPMEEQDFNGSAQAAQDYQFDLSDVSNMSTASLPVVILPLQVNSAQQVQTARIVSLESQAALLRKFATSSGIYGLAAAASPLISLVLTPFLAHNLTPTDYGVLAILNTAMSLIGGITQLGLSSAFFRAYNYDYPEQRDRRAVIATTTTLLCLISLLAMFASIFLAPQLAQLLLGSERYALDVSLAGGVILLQNLTVPGLAWQRAENRPFLYSLLSLSNLLGTLLATLLLVGIWRGGVIGAIIANGLGYACIVLCTLPIIFFRKGIKIRLDIMRNMLAFGVPLVLSFVSYWILQLSDRYLLSLFTSLAQTGRYTVAYTLGSAISAVVIGPFTLAWPTTMFSIAKREDAAEVFQRIFRWMSLFLLLAAFGLALAGVFLLDLLFPRTYDSAAPVIPIVAISIVFYGMYYIFSIGINIKRKTWLASIYIGVAALLNIALNLVLIPSYGIIGAAASTFLAYAVLAMLAYLVNQKMYPIRFEIGLFSLALVLGSVLYIGSEWFAARIGAETYLALGISFCALCFYGGCLVLLLKLPRHKVKKVASGTLGKESSWKNSY